MRTIQDMVQQEVLCCMSHIVATLANGSGTIAGSGRVQDDGARELRDLVEQAAELCYQIPDYEEAAIQAGWRRSERPVEGYWHFHKEGQRTVFKRVDSPMWEELCTYDGLEPYDREVFEHWAVTEWFADKLIEQGEKVDKDFGNLCIWARTTTGQGIASDGVVERIYAAMMAPQKEEV